MSTCNALRNALHNGRRQVRLNLIYFIVRQTTPTINCFGGAAKLQILLIPLHCVGCCGKLKLIWMLSQLLELHE